MVMDRIVKKFFLIFAILIFACNSEAYSEDRVKAYHLVPVDNADKNTIVKYNKTPIVKYFDPQTGLEISDKDRVDGVEYIDVYYDYISPQNYTVNLAKTEFGDKSNYNSLKCFKFDENNKLVETTEQDAVIKYYYDNSTQLTRNTNKTDLTATPINGNYENQTISASIGGVTGANMYHYARGKIGDFNVDFVGNTAESTATYVSGGAVHNLGSIKNMNSNFVSNTAKATTYAYGGAIFNRGSIETLTGSFIDNKAEGGTATSYGGAIFNQNPSASIGAIIGDFIGNVVIANAAVYGGAIANLSSAQIGDITGNFIANQAYSTKGLAYGGAISVSGSTSAIGDIVGDFIGNSAISTTSNTQGGAVYNNSATINSISGDFIGNYLQGATSAGGAAVFNYGKITDGITGDFIANKAIAGTTAANGAGIYNNSNSYIKSIVGDFINNTTESLSEAKAAAIYNGNKATIELIQGDFIGNTATLKDSTNKRYYVQGGAIYNYGTIGKIEGNFIENGIITERENGDNHGGAMLLVNNSVTGDITGDFIGNYVKARSYGYGGAIDLFEAISAGNITGDFIGNHIDIEGRSTDTGIGAYGAALSI